VTSPRSRTRKGGATKSWSLPLAGAAASSILLLLAPAADARARGATFSIQPATGTRSFVVADARPATRVVRTLRVVNSGDAAGAVRLYAVDATTSATSGAVYRSRHDPRRGVGAWTKLSRNRLSLPAGAAAMIRVVVTVPPGASAGQHLGAVVAENTALRHGRAVRRGKGSLRVDLRLLTVDAVLVNLPGRRFEHISLTGARPAGSHGRQTVLVGIRNDGTELLKTRGSFELRDDSGRMRMRSPLRLDTFVPHTEVGFPVRVTGRALPAGSYEAKVTLHYRGGVATRVMPVSVSDANVKQVFKSRPDLAPASPSGLNRDAWLIGIVGLGGGLALAACAASLRGRRTGRTRS
jgi:hypothetical protein